MALPKLTAEQRQRYLKKAEEARSARAELRDRLKSGEVSIEEVFDMQSDIARRMKVSTLLESMPGIGKAKAARIMEELGISESRRVQGLGIRQREQLLAWFESRGR
jgi:predicted HAD superfamily phosphohydrolase